MIRAAAALLLCIAQSTASAADFPTPRSASEAFRQITSARHRSQNLAGPEASEQDLRNAAEQLEQLRALLGQQPYLDFRSASIKLQAEAVNIAIPLAQIYARLGEKEKALRSLENTSSVALIPALDALQKDPTLAGIRDEARFKALLSAHRQGAIASHKGFASHYQPSLPREQRIAGLSLFWSEVRHNFANIDLSGQLDWDAVYLEYLAKVEKAQSTSDYYEVLMQLAPLLNDGHTNIYAPQALHSHFYARPGMRTALVEDAVVVLSVHDQRLNIAPGDQIVAIDGMETQAYAEKYVRPFVSSSTPQDRNVRMYSYQLLSGDAARPVMLTLKNREGKVYGVSAPRTGDQSAPMSEPPFRILPSGVAYIRLDQFENDAGVKLFEQSLPDIQRARGLIIDIRSNGGGSTGHALKILSHLMEKPIEAIRSRVRFEDQAFRAQAGDYAAWLPQLAAAPYPPADKVFSGPVALLIGPKTFSAAEDFAALFVQAKRGILVGETTAGSTGQPLFLDLPGGGRARICVKRDYYADGTEFVGKGITPTHTVTPTIAAIREQADPVLGAADQALQAALASRQGAIINF